MTFWDYLLDFPVEDAVAIGFVLVSIWLILRASDATPLQREEAAKHFIVGALIMLGLLGAVALMVLLQQLR